MCNSYHATITGYTGAFPEQFNGTQHCDSGGIICWSGTAVGDTTANVCVHYTSDQICGNAEIDFFDSKLGPRCVQQSASAVNFSPDHLQTPFFNVHLNFCNHKDRAGRCSEVLRKKFWKGNFFIVAAFLQRTCIVNYNLGDSDFTKKKNLAINALRTSCGFCACYLIVRFTHAKITKTKRSPHDRRLVRFPALLIWHAYTRTWETPSSCSAYHYVLNMKKKKKGVKIAGKRYILLSKGIELCN
ncbi:hypothetical protein C8R45DRAFT_923885 [Mycena sanguinolenta]|nr:hypothetical protein C8R45DRAFT_923885 [Mycena sanguinolenta]